MAKQLRWHDTFSLMDIELIHKLDKNNVVPNALNCDEEYQGEMPWENTQIFRAMVIGENGLERKKKCMWKIVWCKIILMTCAIKRR
jgi:hypothetical protein